MEKKNERNKKASTDGTEIGKLISRDISVAEIKEGNSRGKTWSSVIQQEFKNTDRKATEFNTEVC